MLGDMKMKKINKKHLLILICFVLVFSLGIFFIFRKPSVDPGIEYVQKMEKEKVDTVAKKVHKKRVDELMNAIDEGKLDTFAMFDDYAFFGDSRTMGFSTYGFLPSSTILAGSGHTILNIPDWVETIKKLQPSTIYFSYGVNDMGLKLDSYEGGYKGVYEEKVKTILDVCQDAEIFILSIIQPTEETLKDTPAWREYKNYNKQIKEMCKENKWHYIDCTSLADNGNADIYQSDGIHYLRDFYEVWAKKIIQDTMEVLA